MSNENTSVLPPRTAYFDYLRVFATFAVMLLHVSGQNWGTIAVGRRAFLVFTAYNGMVRWGVAVFVMISGALFLSREVRLEKLLKHNILRLLTAYFAWCFIYYIFADSPAKQLAGLVKQGKAESLITILNGHYHLWFVPMMAGLYLCIPIMKQIVKNETIGKYYLLLAFLFTFLFPEIKVLIDDFGNGRYSAVFDAFYGTIGKFDMDLAAGFFSFFILGYFLAKEEFTALQKRSIWLLGLLGGLFTVGLTLAASWQEQEAVKTYLATFRANVWLEAAGVFVLFRYLPLDNRKIYPLVQKLSKWTFGAYLVHAFVLEMLNKILGLNTLMFSSVLSVPVITCIVFLVSMGISALLNQIPFVNKYLV